MIKLLNLAHDSTRSLEREFWCVLAAYERATIEEASLIAAGNFQEVLVLSRAKACMLDRMQAVAQTIGLDRSDLRLAKRLQGIQLAESLNQDSISCALSETSAEIQKVRSALRNLVSVRGAYGGKESATEFVAEG